MPVLSVQICEVLPSVSTEASRLTIAPRRASRPVPIARVNATTAGSPSGIAATASDTALTNSSPKSCPRTSPSTNTTTMTAPAISASVRLSAAIWRCSGRRLRLGLVQHARDPADLGAHAGGGDHELGATAGDRGVHEHRCRSVAQRRVRVDRIGRGLADRLRPRRSATTPAPPTRWRTAAARRRAPGRRAAARPRRRRRARAASRLAIRPSRRTVAVVTSIFFSASSEASAFDSWTNPMVALSSTTSAMTTGVSHSRVTTQADHRRDQQDDDQQVLELAQERPPPRLAPGLGQLVRTVVLQAARRLGRRQALRERHSHASSRVGSRHRVPGRGGRWRLGHQLIVRDDVEEEKARLLSR